MQRTHCLLLTGVTLLCATTAQAQFTAGNLAIERVGDGTQTLASNGNSIFIDQFARTGGLVNSLAIPSTGGSALINSGTAGSEGALSLSQDGTLLVIAGYNTAVGSVATGTALSSTATTVVPRGVGTVAATGLYSFGAQTTTFNANNIRTGTLSTAGNFFLGGGNSGTVSTPTGGSGAGTAIQTTVANTRVNNVFNGILYFSTGSATGGGPGIFSLGTVPTAATTPTLLLNTGTGSSPYDFALNSTGTTLYIADDRTTAAGGIERFDLVNNTFTLTYTLGTGVANIGARGLAVDFSGANPLIFATTAEGTANRLISILDTGSASTATTLSTAPTNEIYRGLDFAPTAGAAVPEPSTYAMIGGGLGLLLLGQRARRRTLRA